jgi:hypothetical protein
VHANRVRLVDAAGNEAFACDTCDRKDLEDLAATITQIAPTRVRAEVPADDRQPDIVGSDGGAQAIVYEDRYQFWNDFNLNGDDRREVPALQISLHVDSPEPSRIVLQFAAVLADAHYTIGLPSIAPPSSLTVVLNDTKGAPLGGGMFEVRSAGDALTSQLVDNGVCVTGDDGIGGCRFPTIAAGTYQVHQTQAPPGYALPPNDVTVEVAPGTDNTATFQNAEALGSIGVKLTDLTDAPLAGGVFAVYLDADKDGSVGASESEVGRCTTVADGGCGFDRVPLRAYVLREVTAPDGLAAAGDVAFALEQPGQRADIAVVNGPPAVPGTPGTSGTPGSGGSGLPPAVTITETQIVAQPVVQTKEIPVPTAVAGAAPTKVVRQIVKAIGDALRFARRDPGEALLVALVWALIGAPIYLTFRRRKLTLLKDLA